MLKVQSANISKLNAFTAKQSPVQGSKVQIPTLVPALSVDTFVNSNSAVTFGKDYITESEIIKALLLSSNQKLDDLVNSKLFTKTVIGSSDKNLTAVKEGEAARSRLYIYCIALNESPKALKKVVEEYIDNPKEYFDSITEFDSGKETFLALAKINPEFETSLFKVVLDKYRDLMSSEVNYLAIELPLATSKELWIKILGQSSNYDELSKLLDESEKEEYYNNLPVSILPV
jgi:hypothetical protein